MRCLGLFGWLFGHKYQPRYSERRAFPETKMKWSGYLDPTTIMETTKTYHGDVCQRCGHKIPLPQEEAKDA